MRRATVITLVLLLGVGPVHGDPSRKDRPVGDDSTDSAPLNQKPQTPPEDHQVPFGSADQGGGTGDASDTHVKK